MNDIYVNPYKAGSESAKELAAALGVKRVNVGKNSAFKGSPDKVVVNWGASEVSEEVAKCQILNKPEAVALASNKLKFFERFKELHESGDIEYVIPPFTTDKEEVRRWLQKGKTVFARTVLTGNSGRGIIIIEPDAENIPDAPLYTMYIPKKSEYRAHVADGVVHDIQRKARREDVPDDQINWKIRNHANGFIFARNEGLGKIPKSVYRSAELAIKAVGLDFGAVDIIYNEAQAQAYVLEVNTAPGMAGETLANYCAYIIRASNRLLNKNKVIVNKYRGIGNMPAFTMPELRPQRAEILPAWMQIDNIEDDF